jgi:threonine aldolase
VTGQSVEMRSDTFTQPTPAMLRAMAAAPVGDDGYREDPTVRRLEELAAGMLGKPAACLVPSGTMANLCAVLAAVPRGGRVVLGENSDLYVDELRGGELLGGVRYVPVAESADATIEAATVTARLRRSRAAPALICVENTHNRRSGSAYPAAALTPVAALARRLGADLHLDGARLFNAAVALGVPVAELAAPAGTVQVCLAKGLSAPVGAVIAGSVERIDRCRHVRRLLGGQMRQAGVIAAAGVVALTEMVDRLAEDHAVAARLAGRLAEVPGVSVDQPPVRTNIVMITLHGADARAVAERARQDGVRVVAFAADRIRAVTHRGVTAAGADRAADVLAAAVRAAAGDHRKMSQAVAG